MSGSLMHRQLGGTGFEGIHFGRMRPVEGQQKRNGLQQSPFLF
jgi:hypothetical protein